MKKFHQQRRRNAGSSKKKISVPYVGTRCVHKNEDINVRFELRPGGRLHGNYFRGPNFQGRTNFFSGVAKKSEKIFISGKRRQWIKLRSLIIRKIVKKLLVQWCRIYNTFNILTVCIRDPNLHEPILPLVGRSHLLCDFKTAATVVLDRKITRWRLVKRRCVESWKNDDVAEFCQFFYKCSLGRWF